MNIFLYKAVLIWAKRTDVLWVQGNTWSMEGRTGKKGVETMAD